MTGIEQKKTVHHVQPIAVFMACLIIALPIYTADVLAVHELHINKVSGTGDVDGYMKQYDRIMIVVDAKVEGDDAVTPDQVKVNGFDFSSCSSAAVPGRFRCNYASPYYSVAPATYDLSIELFSDQGDALRQQLEEIIVDDNAPEIIFEREPLQYRQNVSVEFTIRERAWDEDDYSMCSGIESIEFWDGSRQLYEIPYPTETCTYTDTIILHAPSSSRITIKAYDLLGNLAARTSDRFTLDNDVPDIMEETFRIEVNGAVIDEYMKGGTYDIDASVMIEEQRLSPENVRLDLSELGGGQSLPADSCTREYHGSYECKWEDAEISASFDKAVNLMITADDDFGNSAEETINRTFRIDATAPTITSIATENTYEGKSFIGSNPTNITMTLSEAGAGMSSRNAYLDLSDVSPVYGIRQADECSQEGGSWICRWNDITTSRSGETVAVVYVISTSDDAGNEATGMTRASLYIDRNVPQFIGDPEFRAIAQQAREGSYYVSGDDLEIVFRARDSSGLRMYGDFSEIYHEEGSGKVEADCEQSDDIWTCQFSIGPLASGHREAEIVFTAEDLAGNTAKIDYPIQIYGRDDEEQPDYWRVADVESMPAALDRQTTPLINQRVYHHIDLESFAGAVILDTDLLDCSGDSGYIKDSRIFNNYRGSTDPYVMFELKTTTAKTDMIEMNCRLQLVSLYNNRVSNPEIEEVSLPIYFYNMPLGEASEELQEKVDDLYDTYIDGWWKVVGGLTTLFRYARLLCNLLYNIRQIVSFVALVKQAWGNVEKATAAVPGVNAAAYATRVGFCLKVESARAAGNEFFEEADKFCNFVNCRMARPEGDVQGLEKWGAVLGGGGGLDLNNWLGAETVAEYTGKMPLGQSWEGSQEFTRYGGYMNVRDNLVMSLLTICIPGIIYNMNKYREIQCGYINCLEESTRTGVPADACDKVKDYQTCKYIFGEIFQAIPIIAFYDYFVRLVKNALSDPFRVVGTAMASYCVHLCELPSDEPHNACIWIKILSDLGDIINNVKAILSKEHWDVKDTYCHEVKERHENDEEKETGGEATEGFTGLS